VSYTAPRIARRVVEEQQSQKQTESGVNVGLKYLVATIVIDIMCLYVT
jgi:hypothetical protein